MIKRDMINFRDDRTVAEKLFDCQRSEDRLKTEKRG